MPLLSLKTLNKQNPTVIATQFLYSVSKFQMNVDGNQENNVFCAVSLSPTLSNPMPVMVLSVYIPTENPQKDYTCRIAKERKTQPVNLLTGQSKKKKRYLGSYEPKTMVQSLHRKHIPKLTTHMASHCKILCIPDKYNLGMSHIQMERTRLCQRASSTYHPRQ